MKWDDVFIVLGDINVLYEEKLLGVFLLLIPTNVFPSAFLMCTKHSLVNVMGFFA